MLFNDYSCHIKAWSLSTRYYKNCPVLLPFCWIARWCKMLFGGKAKRTIRELKTANTVSDDKINTITLMRERLGL